MGINSIIIKISAFIALVLAAIGYKAKVKSDGVKQGREEVNRENSEALLDAVLEDKPIDSKTSFDDRVASELGLMRKSKDEDNV